MGGLVIDIYIEYLYRVLWRAVKRYGSRAWPLAKATVTTCSYPRAGFGCDVAEVYYTYRVDGELFTGIDEKPFTCVILAKITFAICRLEKTFRCE